MFEHILVPLDLSGRQERALRLARELAERSEARVTLLHVVQRIEGLPLADARTIYRRFEKTAQEKLATFAKHVLRASRLDVSLHVKVGAPAEEIVSFADAEDVDLIVMSSHRVDPKDRAKGFGTTSYKVGILCRCPILLVK